MGLHLRVNQVTHNWFTMICMGPCVWETSVDTLGFCIHIIARATRNAELFVAWRQPEWMILAGWWNQLDNCADLSSSCLSHHMRLDWRYSFLFSPSFALRWAPLRGPCHDTVIDCFDLYWLRCIHVDIYTPIPYGCHSQKGPFGFRGRRRWWYRIWEPSTLVTLYFPWWEMDDEDSHKQVGNARICSFLRILYGI